MMADCYICGMSFKRFRRLLTHLEVMHPNDLPDEHLWPNGGLIFFDEEIA